MSLVKGLEDYGIKPFEYAFLTEATSKDAETFRLYLPKLMPMFPCDTPVFNNWLFNNNVFLNDDVCKPRSISTIKTQNFITVPRHLSRDFSPRADGSGNLPKDSKFIVQVMDENIRDIRVSDIV